MEVIKKMKTKVKILFVFVILSFGADAQTVKDVLDSIYKQYSVEKPLNFKSKYELYKTYTTNELHQSYNGEFHKNANNDIYIKINNTEILNNKNINIKVSHDEKLALVTNPETNAVGEYDMAELLKIYKANSFKDKESYWEIELLPNEINLPHSKIILHVRKDYFLKKQIFYYSESVNFSKDFSKTDINRPRLEISYNTYNRVLENEKNFKTATFLQIKSNGSISPASRLRNYEVLDKR